MNNLSILSYLYKALYTCPEFEEDFSMEFPQIYTCLKEGKGGNLSKFELNQCWEYYKNWRKAFYPV